MSEVLNKNTNYNSSFLKFSHKMVWTDKLIDLHEEFYFIYFFNFIFKLYNIVLVLPNIEMNPPQVYLCSPF